MTTIDPLSELFFAKSAEVLLPDGLPEINRLNDYQRLAVTAQAFDLASKEFGSNETWYEPAFSFDFQEGIVSGFAADLAISELIKSGDLING